MGNVNNAQNRHVVFDEKVPHNVCSHFFAHVEEMKNSLPDWDSILDVQLRKDYPDDYIRSFSLQTRFNIMNKTSTPSKMLVLFMKHIFVTHRDEIIPAMSACVGFNLASVNLFSYYVSVKNENNIIGGDLLLARMRRMGPTPLVCMFGFERHAQVIFISRKQYSVYSVQHYNPWGSRSTKGRDQSERLIRIFRLYCHSRGVTVSRHNKILVGSRIKLQTKKKLVSGYCTMFTFMTILMYAYYHQLCRHNNIPLSLYMFLQIQAYFFERTTIVQREEMAVIICRYLVHCIYKHYTPEYSNAMFRAAILKRIRKGRLQGNEIV